MDDILRRAVEQTQNLNIFYTRDLEQWVLEQTGLGYAFTPRGLRNLNRSTLNALVSSLKLYRRSLTLVQNLTEQKFQLEDSLAKSEALSGECKATLDRVVEEHFPVASKPAKKGGKA